MPLYAYRCTQCGHKFEKIQNFSAEQETECPKCHGLLERPLTAPRLHFKGAGWYVNDYAAKGSEPASDSGTEAKPADAKAPAKTDGSAPAPASTPAAAPAAAPSSSASSSSAPSSSGASSSTPSSTS
ncbi:MAG: FmdB family zinc ribbon protein [Terracidiphilus sp.]